MTTVLVANRGEIARRIFRTCRRLGMRTVAVYSDADAAEPFVREADQAVRIGPAPAPESYLAIDRILAAARESGAELVHPGYGFLAEEADFARAVTAAGLTFVGPPAEVLALTGSKAEAKATATRASLPVVPGYSGEDQRDAVFVDVAAELGYPVLVKPSAAGGGKGMHVARDDAELRAALAKARRVAAGAFGDDRLILERYLASPRHIEVQVLADQRGTITALGERDCSAQRRYQKILEESPAPGVDEARRARLGEAAVTLARAVGYVNAGTVEFIVDASGAFYFLEVNARLQVEHPVTELRFGVDLVDQQLRIAMGERLDVRASPRGHAIEARVYAEAPAGGFVPSTGTAVHVAWPEDVRVDAGIEEGSRVTRHYDPLLAKLVAHGPDRATALAALRAALDRASVLGVETNLPFLRALVRHDSVVRAEVTTDFVERELPRLVAAPERASSEVVALASCALLDAQRSRSSRRDPWYALGASRASSVSVYDGGHERVARVAGAGPYRVDGIAIARGTERHEWSIDGGAAAVAIDRARVWVDWGGRTDELSSEPPARSVAELAATDVVAPLPGVVVAVEVKSGQRVRRGQTLFVVEAMKMELPVTAPADGVVRAVLRREGDQVERGQRLVEFEAERA